MSIDQFILPQIPPSLSGDVFEADKDDALLQGVKSAMSQLRNATERALIAARAGHANEMLTIPARHAAVRDAVHKASGAAFKAVDDATSRLTTEIARLDQLISAPPPANDAKDVLKHQTIHQAFRAMDAKARREEVARSIGRSVDLAAAILCYDPFVSGLSEMDWKFAQLQWQQARWPDQAKRHEMLLKAAEHLDRAGKLGQSTINRMYSVPVVTEAERLAKAADDALRGAAA